ncbi:hypothetical protein [Comamonas sp. F1-6]|uniref:hypothetical protein n=1 Tax=Comamonas sp. F1-6 TaxID=673550 RepID=UPI0031CE83A1
MSQPELTPKIHSLNSGQAASLLFEPGSELFCQQGPLRLAIGPLSFTDNHFGQVMVLQTGQSWRCPSRTWVQLSTPAGAAWIQYPAARIQQSRAAQRLEEGKGLSFALARIWQQIGKLGLRRGQRAA